MTAKQPSLATRVIELVENARRNLAQAIYATMLRKSSVGSLRSLGTLGSVGPLQLLGTLGNAENKWRLKELPRVPRIPRNPRELRHPSVPRRPGPLRKAEENVPCLQSQIPCLY